MTYFEAQQRSECFYGRIVQGGISTHDARSVIARSIDIEMPSDPYCSGQVQYGFLCLIIRHVCSKFYRAGRGIQEASLGPANWREIKAPTTTTLQATRRSQIKTTLAAGS